MSEHLRQQVEQSEQLDLDNESEKNLERLRKAAAEASPETPEIIDSLAQAAKTEAISGKEITVGEHGEDSSQQTPLGMHRELKQVAYQRGLERIQGSLNRPERAFSKVVHQPVVDTVSSVVAKTVARPSGILVGAIFALIGSLALQYFARRYGFTYNYLVFMFMFVTGYIFGLLVEVIIRLVRRH